MEVFTSTCIFVITNTFDPTIDTNGPDEINPEFIISMSLILVCQ